MGGHYTLNRRRATALASTVLANIRQDEISTHSRAGRNKMYMISAGPNNQFLLKQSVSKRGQIGEANAYEILSRHKSSALCVEPIFVSPKINTVCIPYFDDEQTLEEISKKGLRKILPKVDQLVKKISENLIFEPCDKAFELSKCSLFPVPHLRTLNFLNVGTLSLLHETQRETLISLQRKMSLVDLDFCLAHGDIKFDNVLVVDGAPVFIDWELAHFAPVGWDISALFACTLMTWIQSKPEPDEFVEFSELIELSARWLRDLNKSLLKARKLPVTSYQFSTMAALSLLNQILHLLSHRNEIGLAETQGIKLVKLISEDGEKFWN